MRRKSSRIIAIVLVMAMVIATLNMNTSVRAEEAIEKEIATSSDAESESIKSDEEKDSTKSEEVGEVDDSEEEHDTAEMDQEDLVAFSQSQIIDGVRVSVEAEEGVFPEGATLSVEKVSNTDKANVEKAVDKVRDNDTNVALSYTFDIKVLDKNGNELQPADGQQVKVSFKTDEIYNTNLTTDIYHVGEEDGTLSADALSVSEYGDVATANTDGFSFYTVEFTYGEKQYVMDGDTTISLSDILDYVGLSGEVSAVSVSDESLFSASKESGEWIVTAHQAFTSNEWLKVTVDGVEYEIVVTDAVTQTFTFTLSNVNNLTHNITEATYTKDTKFVFNGYNNNRSGSNNSGPENMFIGITFKDAKGNKYHPTISYSGNTDGEYSNGYLRFFAANHGRSGQGPTSCTFTLDSLPNDATKWKICNIGQSCANCSGGVAFDLVAVAEPATNPTLTNTTANYDGSVHAISTSGGSGGTVYYATSEDNSTWSDWTTTVPSRTEPGTTYVKAKVVGDNFHDDSTETSVYTIVINNPAIAPTLIGWTGTYDSTDHFVTATGASGGTVNYRTSTDGSTWGSWTTTVPSRTDAGTTYVQAYTKGDNNHSDSTTVSATITINRAALNITSKAQTITYGDSITTGTGQVTVSGLVSSDTLDSITLTPSTSNVTTNGTITPSAATIKKSGTNVTNNYSITYNTGALKINKKTITIASGITASDKNYDGTTNATLNYSGINWTSCGMKSGDTLSVTATGTFADANAGDGKTVRITGLTMGGSSAGNYQLAASGNQSSTTANITTKAITITSATDVKEYDGKALTNNEITVSGDGWADGEGATYDVSGSQKIVGSSQNTFTYTLNAGTNAENYNITTVYGTLTVTNRDAKYEIEPQAKSDMVTYDGADHEVTGFVVDTYEINGESYTVSGLTANGSEKNAGEYTVYVSGTAVVKDEDGNDVSSQFSVNPKTGKLIINPKVISLEWDGDDLTYNGQEQKPTATAKDLVDGDTCEVTVDGGAVDAGKHTATATALSNQNYKLPDSATCEYTIEKKDISGAEITLGKALTYNGSEQTQTVASVKIDGLDVTYTVVGNTGTDAEEYTLTVSGTGNFTGTATKKWNISKAQMPITVNGYSGKYDGNNHSIELTVPENAQIYYSLTEAGPYTKLEKPEYKNVGNYTVYYQVNHPNYLTVKDSANVEISERSVILTSEDDIKIYDGQPLTNSVVSVSGDGFVDGEGATYSVTGAQTNAGRSTNSFTYTLNSNTAENNYKITKKEGMLTVSQKKATIKIKSLSKTYGEADPEFEAEVDGAVGSEELSYTLARAEGENVNTYVIDATLGSNPNYDVDITNGTFNITKRPATIKADDKSKSYGTEDPELTATVTGNVDGETLDYTVSRTDGENYGEYAITVTPGSNPNYEVTTKDGTFTIGKRAVTITAEAKTKTYGDEDPALTAKVEGELPGDTINYTLSRETGNDVGEYKIVVTPGENGNYIVTTTDSKLTINPKAVKIDATDSDKLYGDEDPEFEYTLTDGESLAYDEKLTDDGLVSGSLSREKGEDVGVYNVTVGSLESKNYTFTVNKGQLEIKKRQITVKAEDKEKDYGEADPELTYVNDEETPLFNNDTLEEAVKVTLSREEGEKAGEYTIKADSIESKNYDVTFEEGTFTIKRTESGAEFELDKDASIKASIDKTDDEMLDIVLTDEDRQMVKDGAGVRVYFDVTKATASAADKTKILSVAGDGAVVGDTYNIDLFKKFAHLAPEQIHTISKPVTFTFALSGDMTTVPDGYTREYKVVTIHDGQAKALSTSYDDKNKSVSFPANEFSIFAVTYIDTPESENSKPADVKNKPNDSKPGESAKTGDMFNIGLVLLIMIISAIISVFIILRKRILNKRK